MGMVIKSKQMLTATLVIALTAAVAVNWYFTNNPPKDIGTTQQVSGNLGDSLYVAGTTAAEETTAVQENTTAQNSTAEADEYFADAKLKRSQANDEIIDSIEDILDEDNLSKAEEGKITILLSDFQQDIKAQIDAENLIKAKTGSECLVVINNDSCQVILEKNTLNEALILQISEIIEKNANISAENLTIIELK